MVNVRTGNFGINQVASVDGEMLPKNCVNWQYAFSC